MKTASLQRFGLFGRLLCALAVLAITIPFASQAAVGSWQKVSNFPYSNPGHMLLLTDGTVLVQQSSSSNWFLLSPDTGGHYVKGNWSTVGSMHYWREYYASQVLQNGNVFVAGGEYGPTDTGKTTEIYNPSSQSWTLVNSAEAGLADAESILIQNGNVLAEPVGFYNGSGAYTLLFDPSGNSWSVGPQDFSYQDEATWVKLPDGSVLSVDIYVGGTTSERYIPSLNLWVLDADLKNPVEGGAGEVGGAFMLPNGQAFWLGGNGETALYSPSGTTNHGTWFQGPNMPTYNGPQYNWTGSNYTTTPYDGLLTTQDAPAAMMVNGKILCDLSTDESHTANFFYEFDPTTLTFTATGCPTNNKAGSLFLPWATKSDATSMVDLPDGTVLYNDTGSLYIYTPSGSPLVAATPAIQSVTWNTDGSLHLTGTLFNGICQGASYGDDAQQDSNYPLVRFTDGSGDVTYGRTYNWSDTGVQTGGKIVSTDCAVPSAIYESQGSYTLQVVANGIASASVTFNSPVWVDFNYTGEFQFGTYNFPYKTLADGISAVTSQGTIAIDSSSQPSQSGETMTISTPMTIISVNGPATIGN